MKHCFVIGELAKGGQEKQLLYLIQELDKKTIPLGLIIWSYRENDHYASHLNTLKFPMLRLSSNFSTIKKLKLTRAFLIRHQPKTLHSFAFYLNFFAWLITLNTSTTAIGGIRSSLPNYRQSMSLYKFLLCCLFPKFKVSNNYSFAKGIGIALKWLLHRSKIFVLGNKLDISAFSVKKYEHHKKLISTSIGNIKREKRLDLLVWLIHELRNAGYDITHYHAGEGRLRPHIEQQIEQKKLKDHFILLGSIEGINDLLIKSDFFVHAAEAEGMPNVIMEAMASGLPVLTTDCGDAKEIVKNKFNGFVIPINDKTPLYLKAKTLIEDASLREKFGRKSRSIAENNFHLDKLATECLSIYRNIHAIQNSISDSGTSTSDNSVNTFELK